MAKRGRKPLRNDEYTRGYHTGWERIKREFEGLNIGQRRYVQSENYQEALGRGMEAAEDFYYNYKGGAINE